MVILIHVLIALASIGYTSYLFISPTRGNFRTAYGLVGLTITSGTYLVVSMPAHMVQSCVTGLIYIAAVSVAIESARYKLAAIKNRG